MKGRRMAARSSLRLEICRMVGACLMTMMHSSLSFLTRLLRRLWCLKRKGRLSEWDSSLKKSSLRTRGDLRRQSLRGALMLLRRSFFSHHLTRLCLKMVNLMTHICMLMVPTIRYSYTWMTQWMKKLTLAKIKELKTYKASQNISDIATGIKQRPLTRISSVNATKFVK